MFCGLMLWYDMNPRRFSMENSNKTKRFLKSLIPIAIYFIALVIITAWESMYIGTETVWTFALLFYLPYELGGAFVLCLIQGILVRKWSQTNKIASRSKILTESQWYSTILLLNCDLLCN